MKLGQIIKHIIATPAYDGTFIQLAAFAARTGDYDACRDVVEHWILLGGVADDPRTGASLTAVELNDLRDAAIDADDTATAELCRLAIGTGVMRDRAREAIAKHLNAVAANEVA